MTAPLKIHYINHASVLLELGEVRLLSDPRYFGTSFEDGWGLRYDNPRAFELASKATHLWISHFHGDHFHIPTLKKLLEINPGITVLANRSYNFQLDQAMRDLGFKNVVPLLERQFVPLADGVDIARYPTTGIDNMLLIRSPQGTILNYNDCNVPPPTRKRLGKKFGEIDIFLTKRNHAGKLLIHPFPGADEIIGRIKRAFQNNCSYFAPTHIFPFASYHYYRAPESFQQNEAMLQSSAEINPADNRFLRIDIGDVLTFDKATGVASIEKHPVEANSLGQLSRSESKIWEQLAAASQKYCDTLRQRFGLATLLLPKFHIHVADLNVTAQLTRRDGLVKVNHAGIVPHITAHSEAISNWFELPYGTDSFVVGAHFKITNQNLTPLKWQIVFGMLIDNRLDLRSLLKMCVTPGGIRFLFNRREEIFGILTSFQLAAEYHD